MSKSKWYENRGLIILLIAFGVFVVIPDPLDFIGGLGTIAEGISLILGIYLGFRRTK